MTYIDTRTEREKARDAKHQQITNEYLEMANTMPGTASHRLFRILAERHNMTIPGIRNILIKNGIYSTK